MSGPDATAATGRTVKGETTMSDRMRQVIAYLIAMVMVSAFVALPTVARTIDPGVDGVVLAAQGNSDADMVDGRHAVKFSMNRNERAGHIVATNHKGYLPSNIVKPFWGNIKHMPVGFADGVDDTGVARLQTSIVHSSPMTLIPGEVGSVRAVCAPGWSVVGGGFRGPDVLSAFTSFPADDHSWYVRAENTAASSDAEFSAYAVCLIARPKELIGF